MRRTLTVLAFAAATAIACKGEAAPTDPKALYRVEASAEPTSLEAGKSGTFRIAVRPNEGAEVKAETPFRATLAGTGSVSVGKAELAYADNARIEGKGPVFEIPFEAKAAGAGELEADLVFFVCTDEACLRTTDQVSVPVTVR